MSIEKSQQTVYFVALLLMPFTVSRALDQLGTVKDSEKQKLKAIKSRELHGKLGPTFPPEEAGKNPHMQPVLG